MASSMLNLAAARVATLGPAGADALRGKRGGAPSRLPMRLRASAVNPSIRKDVDKVVDNVDVANLEKTLTAYCRCWRSGKFPLCDGSHVKHNKETGDNVGPLLIKKSKTEEQ